MDNDFYAYLYVPEWFWLLYPKIVHITERWVVAIQFLEREVAAFKDLNSMFRTTTAL